jgi:hypothetical protein
MRLTLGACVLTLICTALIGLSRGVGWIVASTNTSRRIISNLLDTGDCSQPCWHNIEPGKTTLDQAEILLQREGSLVVNVKRHDGSGPTDLGTKPCDLHWHLQSIPNYDGCALANNNIIWKVVLHPVSDPRSGISLAELLPSLGVPQSFEACRGNEDEIFIYLHIDEYVEVLSIAKLPAESGLVLSEQAFSPVTEVIYSSSSNAWISDSPWRGFAAFNTTTIAGCPW